MTIVGGNYGYDLFFSYPWAEASESNDLRNWSLTVIDCIRSLVSQKYNTKDRKLKPYIDRDSTLTGDDLDSSIRKALEAAAVTVFFVGRFNDSEYCQKELDWFVRSCEGRPARDRSSIFRIQPLTKDEWPSQLRNEHGAPLVWLDLCDEIGPLDMAAVKMKAPTLGLVEPVQMAVLDICRKLDVIRATEEARARYRQSQTPPDRPLMYFEAEAKDAVQWTKYGHQLSAAPSIVLPGRPIPATEEPIELYSDCDAVILFRSRPDDDIAARIRKAYLGRRKVLTDRSKALPWALLDESDDPPAEADAFEIPRITPTGDWVERLKQALVA